MHRWVSCLLLTLLVGAGCGGGGGSQALSAATGDSSTRLTPMSVATGPLLLQINAGGPATSGFAADQFSVGYSGTNADAKPVDLSASGSAPQDIYNTYRTAPKTLTYSITGLAPNGAYTGELYFEEPLLGGAGRRVMNVTVGGVSEATGLDIYALTGATHRAYTLPISGTATANGTLDIVLTATVNDAILSGFTLHPPFLAIDPATVEINAGGPATAGFAADNYFYGYSGTNADTNPIDVSAPSAAPAAIYASYRTAPKKLFYSITRLDPNHTYHGFLHFEEPLLAGVGRRVQNVFVGEIILINGLDIYKLAGKTHKAVVIPFEALADGTGAIDIELDAVVNDTIISGFEFHEDPASGNS